MKGSRSHFRVWGDFEERSHKQGKESRKCSQSPWQHQGAAMFFLHGQPVDFTWQKNEPVLFKPLHMFVLLLAWERNLNHIPSRGNTRQISEQWEERSKHQGVPQRKWVLPGWVGSHGNKHRGLLRLFVVKHPGWFTSLASSFRPLSSSLQGTFFL